MTELLSWQGILALFLGGLYGSLFGAIPGLTATLAVALFVPVAFFLDPIIALPAIIAISSVAIFAGDVGSIIARIPGTPASAAYLEELFEVGRRSGPMYPLGLSAIASAVGGVIGTLLLIAGATGIAGVAARFSSFEYFWVAVLGLTAGVMGAGGHTLKAVISLLLGLLFSTVGIDPTLGHPRFHFGSATLLGGIDYVVAMVGLFGFSEVLTHVYRGRATALRETAGAAQGSVAQFFVRPVSRLLRRPWLVLRSSLVGIGVGMLPGAGADVAAWVSTSIQKLRGGGETDERQVDTVLAGSSSNNAAVAAAWIPALSLGLPGDTVTAIVLSIFLMKGITPGPLLFQNDIGLVWSLYLTFIVAAVVLLPVFGYLTARLADRVVRMPLNLLLCVIAGVCVVGAYALSNNPYHVWIMAGMGVLAFLLRLGGFPLAQVVLGMVLGPILEQNFMVSAIIARWDLTAFLERPLALVLMLATVAIVVVPVVARRRRGADKTVVMRAGVGR
ncbi:MAG TPA: tripartite tricarboxylate transporter permease [Longimicrobiales bacterium]|nr:tripartite tricarboxylate transporter permease [Longimicrobiales bacterium]